MLIFFSLTGSSLTFFFKKAKQVLLNTHSCAKWRGGFTNHCAKIHDGLVINARLLFI